MLKKIESLRSKPKEIRNRYAFWYAFGFTGVIVVFWLVSVPSRLTVLTNAKVESPIEIEGGVSRSFSDLRASIADGVSLFNKIKEGSDNEELADTQEGTIDFSTFFSTSTGEAMEEFIPQKRGKPVLIGTTSQARSTSTDD